MANLRKPNANDATGTFNRSKNVVQYGSRMKDIPLGAIGIYTCCQKIGVGLQQLMAGSRNFRLSTISRKDLMALTEDAANVSGIPYVMDAYSAEANKILED